MDPESRSELRMNVWIPGSRLREPRNDSLQESGAEIGCRLPNLAAMFSAMERIMAKRHYVFLGPALVLLFCVSQAFRDVYFGHVFQGVDFFVVILLAFLASTILFTVVPLLRDRSAFAKLRGQGRTVLMMNLTTALAWSCYFYGLSHLEPSIVNTMHSGMGPLTVVILAAFGVRLAKTDHVGWWGYLGYAGIALSLMALAWIVLSGNSGLAGSATTALLSLGSLLISGASITVSLLYCKRLHDHGVNAEVVTSVRYLLLIAVAASMVWHKGGLVGFSSAAPGGRTPPRSSRRAPRGPCCRARDRARRGSRSASRLWARARGAR